MADTKYLICISCSIIDKVVVSEICKSLTQLPNLFGLEVVDGFILMAPLLETASTNAGQQFTLLLVLMRQCVAKTGVI